QARHRLGGGPGRDRRRRGNRVAVRGLGIEIAATHAAASPRSRLASPTVDDHDALAREQPVNDETRVYVRWVLPDRRRDLLHDLLSRDVQTEHGTAGRHDVEDAVVSDDHDRSAPTGAVVGAAPGDDGAGGRVVGDRELQVRETRDLAGLVDRVDQVLRRVPAVHRAVLLDVGAGARLD